MASANQAPNVPISRSCLTGALAAASACFFSNPLDVTKTRMQLAGEMGDRVQRSYRSFHRAILKIFRSEGIRGLQSGLRPALAYQIATHGTRLGLYPNLDYAATKFFLGPEHVKVAKDVESYKKRDRHGKQWIIKIITGTISGMIGAVVGNPLFLLKTRLQAQSAHLRTRSQNIEYEGMTHAAKHVFQEQGLRGFFQGTSAAVGRVGVGSGVQLSTYDTCKNIALYYGGFKDGPVAHLCASLTAGLFVVLAMNPFDVVSTRMYHQTDAFYSSPLDCAAKTLKTEGIRGLYKGARAQYIRTGPHTVLVFMFLEQYRNLLLHTRVVDRPSSSKW